MRFEHDEVRLMLRLHSGSGQTNHFYASMKPSGVEQKRYCHEEDFCDSQTFCNHKIICKTFCIGSQTLEMSEGENDYYCY